MVKVVRVIKPFLGLKKGTLLYLNPKDNTYSHDYNFESVGDDEYRRAENFIEISATMVEQNIGKYFAWLGVDEQTKQKEMDKEKNVAAEVSKAVREDIKLANVAEAVSAELQAEAELDAALEEVLAEEQIAEADEKNEPQSDAPVNENEPGGSDKAEAQPKRSADLMLHCSVCGTDSKIATVDDDIAIYMPLDKDAKATFVCPKCGATLEVFYDNIQGVDVQDAFVEPMPEIHGGDATYAGSGPEPEVEAKMEVVVDKADEDGPTKEG